MFLKKKMTKQKTSVLPFFLLLSTISGLIVYDVILIFGLMATNSEKITDYGKTAISNTVQFTSTAILEGFGETSDYFENKWESNYINYFEQVDIKLISKESKPYNEQRSQISLDIEFNNHNPSENELFLNTISNNNYILISEDNETFYSLEFDFKQSVNKIPSGKTRLIMKGLIPLDFTPTTIKIGEKSVKI
jgi:hypothetical protein